MARLQELEAYLKAVIMCSYLRCDAQDFTQIGYAGLRSLLHERRRAATAAVASSQSGTSPSTDSIRAAVAEQLAPMADQLAALNAPDGPLNTLSAKVNNIGSQLESHLSSSLSLLLRKSTLPPKFPRPCTATVCDHPP
eukprot:jgi/Mesvir1/21771/Mv26176-RA.1